MTNTQKEIGINILSAGTKESHAFLKKMLQEDI